MAKAGAPHMPWAETSRQVKQSYSPDKQVAKITKTADFVNDNDLASEPLPTREDALGLINLIDYEVVFEYIDGSEERIRG